jgi:Leucine-rich repeat (LRR) protein
VKKYLEFINESLIENEIRINSESEFYLIKPGVEIITASYANLNYLPKFPKSLKYLDCSENNLTYLPELPEGLINLDCFKNNLSSLPELPESLEYLCCDNNPLDYPIPHKFYYKQEEYWLEKLIYKLSTYNHQKKLINKHGIYIMKKFENHTELINDKIKEENPTYFLSVEYGF